MAKIEVEADLQTLLNDLQNRPEKLSFRETMAAAFFHAALMGKADRFTTQMASDMEVAVSTVRRWARGHSNPHPSVRAVVLKSLRKTLTALASSMRISLQPETD